MKSYEHDVFLSFTAEDEELARPVWDELRRAGLSVFWSSASLGAGANFLDTIQSALLGSRHFLVVYTARAAASDWVKEEIDAFYERCYVHNKESRKILFYRRGFVDPGAKHPFLAKIQCAESIPEVVSALSGVDYEGILRENAALQRRVLELEDALAAARRAASTPPVVEPVSAVLPSSEPQAPSSAAADDVVGELRRDEPRGQSEDEGVIGEVLLEAVEAMDAALVSSGAGMYSSVSVAEGNAARVWRPIHERFGGLEIPVLGRMIEGSSSSINRDREGWTRRVRCVLLLRRSVGTPVGRAHVPAIFESLRGPLAGDPFLQKPALEIVTGGSVEPAKKWAFLDSVLDEAVASGQPEGGAMGALIAAYVSLTPAARREATTAKLLDFIERSDDASALHAAATALKQMGARDIVRRVGEILEVGDPRRSVPVLDVLAPTCGRAAGPAIVEALRSTGDSAIRQSAVRALRALGYREGAPAVRELLAWGDATAAREAASALMEWRDAASVAPLREALERYRLGNDGSTITSLFSALRAIGGAEVSPYLVQVLLEALPQAQQYLLGTFRTQGPDDVIRKGLAELAERADDGPVRTEARRLVASA